MNCIKIYDRSTYIDLFFIDMSCDIANYADDTTPYECENLELTI